MPRFDELDIMQPGLGRGKRNAISDVPGVQVGHFTLIKGQGSWQPGKGPFRTGVTVILPHGGNLYEEKVPAAVHTINGFGKVVGFEQIRELGNIETPIALTGTLNVPRVADALITLAIEQNPHIGIGFEATGRRGYASVNPIVGETSDGFLSDIQARPIGESEVRAAIMAASSEVTEGSVGAGTGTSCFGWKGGIGTASRVLGEAKGGFTIGGLVQSNFGNPLELTIVGVPVGAYLRPPRIDETRSKDGSIMIILATDAPFDSRQLGRLCRRAVFGLARTGSTCHGGSGDFVIAFSTANIVEDRPKSLITSRTIVANEQQLMSSLSLAVIEVVEESIYNSLLMADTVVGRDGNTRYALSADEVQTLVRKHRMQNSWRDA